MIDRGNESYNGWLKRISTFKEFSDGYNLSINKLKIIEIKCSQESRLKQENLSGIWILMVKTPLEYTVPFGPSIPASNPLIESVGSIDYKMAGSS